MIGKNTSTNFLSVFICDDSDENENLLHVMKSMTYFLWFWFLVLTFSFQIINISSLFFHTITPVVFRNYCCRSSDSKSPQIFFAFVSILANFGKILVWIALLQINRSSSIFTRLTRTVSPAPLMLSTTVTITIHIFLVRCCRIIIIIIRTSSNWLFAPYDNKSPR